MKSVLERKAVSVADVEALSPAISAYVRGRISAAEMATAMTLWVHGRRYDLGRAESLSDKILRSLAMEGPASAKDIAKRIESELDSVYHALFRLQKRKDVRCIREVRPHVWKISSGISDESESA